MSSSNITTILKLREFVSPNYVLQQFGVLSGLKAQLDYIFMQGDKFITNHNNKTNKNLILEIEPDLYDTIKSKQLSINNVNSFLPIIADQMRFWQRTMDK